MLDRKTLAPIALLIASFPATTLIAQQAHSSTKAPPHRITAERTANKPEARSTNLPVRRVSLYKNGIGFFEHIGSVSGNEKVTIDFTTAQLNDVLQSLTAIDLNGGHIAGAGYNSTTPFDQQLKALPLALGEDPTAVDFYQAIRGARVEVHTGNSVFTGRLLNIEIHAATAASKSDNTDAIPPPSSGIEKRYLTIISDTGTVRSIELTSTTEVRLLDTALHQDVARYLELLASTRNQGLRHLTLDANGSGARELHVSYISEVPVWKSTYRILFTGNSATEAGTKTATLQGWAVVDNTVGEDWDKVELSLIAGAPQSFIQTISQPYYTRRPEIPLPQDAQLTPQTHESGDEAEAQRSSANGSAGGVLGGMASAATATPSFGPGSRGGIAGGAYRAKQFDKLQAVAPIAYEDSAAASTTANTRTSSFDDYFEYKLTDPITIRKNESALVPILQTKVDADRVTLWSPSQPQALRALWIKNTSNLTLDRGSFSIVEDGRFGGEGLLEVVHPNERRLLSYAADQAVRVTVQNEHDTRRLQQIAVSKGILTERTIEVADREYLVHNAALESRHVIVEHPIRQGWELTSDTKPAETTATIDRFDVFAAPGATVRLRVAEQHTVSQHYQLASMGEQQLDLLLRTDGANSAQIRQQLSPIFEAKRKLADIDAQLAAKQTAIDEIGNDQKRLRDNLAALKGSTEERALVRRYTDELNQQEDKLAALHHDQDTLRQQRSTAEADLSTKIEALQMEQNIP